MNQLEDVFRMFYNGVCNAAKYIYATKMVISLFKNAGDKDIEGAVKSVMNGSANYALLNSVLTILNSIQNKFN